MSEAYTCGHGVCIVHYMMTGHIQVQLGIFRVLGGKVESVAQGHVGDGVALLYSLIRICMYVHMYVG